MESRGGRYSDSNNLNSKTNTNLKEPDEIVTPIVEEPIDFLNSDANDNHSDLNALNAIDIKPVTLFTTRNSHNNKLKKKAYCVLIDTGSEMSTIRPEIAHHGMVKKAKVIKFRTPNGTFESNRTSAMKFFLSEFSESREISHEFRVIPEGNKMPYDMIIGRDLLRALKMDVIYSENIIAWDDLRLPMQEVTQKEKFIDFAAYVEDSTESESVKHSVERLNRILDANYEKPNMEEEVSKMEHLTEFQRTLLLALLQRHELLFDGQLGDWKGPAVEIPLKENATPYHARSYPIPHIHEQTFKKDLDRLVAIGVLTKVNRSEWAAPAFIVPKKDGRVRFVSDFRKLNKHIKRTPYPLPHIKDMLLKVSHFTYATALDLVMGYYNITLSDDAKKLCTITTPFGKYEYNRLPMGVSIAPDIFQDRICQLFEDIESVRAYIDDLLIVTHGSFEEHIQELDLVMSKLQDAGLKCKLDKCMFAQPELEYLGYIITKEGVKPNPKKVQAILDLQRPTNKTEVRQFVGMVQYYRDLWPRRSHLLGPLTELTKGGGKGAIQWSLQCEAAFNEMKRLIAHETLLAYPDFNKKFTIHTDASDYQLGAVIMQEGKPLAFYSRKLSTAQRNYTTTEKELLSILETLKEFRNILLGYEIEVYTDHKNLTFGTNESSSQRTRRWESLVQEFGIELKYIEGDANVVADAISRLPMEEHAKSVSRETHEKDLCMLLGLSDLFMTETTDCFASTAEDTINYPLSPQVVEVAQKLELNDQSKQTSEMRTALDDPNSSWDYREVEGVKLLHFSEKIYVPKSLRNKVITWYHHYLCHPGGDRLASTLKQVCVWKGMINQARNYCTRCPKCQKFKKRSTKYGHVPPKEAETMEPWHTVCVDLIGNYSVKAKVRQTDGSIKVCEINLLCMTFIDPATGWFEIVEVPQIDQTSARMSQLFDEVWLSRYPRPRKVIYDNGTEFKKNFQPLLKDFAIKPTCTSIKNPQANAILERIHQVVGSMLKTKDLVEVVFDVVDLWSEILASIAYAVRCSYHSTLKGTPGQLVFGRDMLLDLKYEPNYQQVWADKQRRINYDNIRENSKRTQYDYKVGGYAYVLRDGNYRKLEGDKQGPYRITEVFTNGTVRIQKGIVNERINIRRLTPHFGEPPN